MSTPPNTSLVCEGSATNGRNTAPFPGCQNWIHGDYTPLKRFGYETEHFDIYIYGKNIFDKDYTAHGFYEGY